jgi:hypothetical protein
MAMNNVTILPAEKIDHQFQPMDTKEEMKGAQEIHRQARARGELPVLRR